MSVLSMAGGARRLICSCPGFHLIGWCYHGVRRHVARPLLGWRHSGIVCALFLWAAGFSLEANTVTLVWDPNSESDLAGYRLYYAEVSGNYDQQIDVGNTTTNTVSGLVQGRTYYFVVTAYNISGLESDPSNEVSTTIPLPNQPPTADTASYASPEDQPVTVTLRGADIDGDPLTCRVVTPPGHGALTGTAPNLTYTPAANYNGPDSFTFVVNDGSLDSAPATVTLAVTPVNDTPTAYGFSVTTAQGVAATILLSGTDPDSSSDLLSFLIVQSPSHGKLLGTPPDLLYIPNSGFSGLDDFAFAVSDGDNDSLPATVSIEVTPAPDPPVVPQLPNRPVLSIQWVGPGTTAAEARMSFMAELGGSYVLQGSADLVCWFDLDTKTADRTGPIEFIDSAVPTTSIRYYRLELR